MGPISGEWISLIGPLALGAIAIWIKYTIAEKTDDVRKEIRGLSEKLIAEIALNSRERDLSGVNDQIAHQHTVESSVEHERITESLLSLSKQLGKQSEQTAKQTEVIVEIVTILKNS